MQTTFIKSIENEQDLDNAMNRIDQIIDAQPGTEAYEELKVLGDLVFAYEQKHHAIEPPDPIDLLITKLEDQAIDQQAFNRIFTSRTQKSLMLNRKRRVPVEMMYKLIREFNIPAESFFKSGYFENFFPPKAAS